jgi:hypothetical protein
MSRTLTSKEYEAVGKLALAFNEVEAVIDDYLPSIIGAPEWRVAEFFAARDEGFVRKTDRLSAVVKRIEEHFGALRYITDAVLNLLKEAKELAARRNEYVHAVVVFDFRKNATKIKKRVEKVDREEVFDEAGVIALARQASDLAIRLDNELGNLLGPLVELRPK